MLNWKSTVKSMRIISGKWSELVRINQLKKFTTIFYLKLLFIIYFINVLFFMLVQYARLLKCRWVAPFLPTDVATSFYHSLSYSILFHWLKAALHQSFFVILVIHLFLYRSPPILLVYWYIFYHYNLWTIWLLSTKFLLLLLQRFSSFPTITSITAI